MKNTRLRPRLGKVGLSITALSMALFVRAILMPSIVTWTPASLEIDHSVHHSAAIEAQILAIEKRDPHEIFSIQAQKLELFLYAIADKQVVVPGVENFQLSSAIPLRVIARTGESGTGARNEHLDRIARVFAERYNREMHDYISTW